MAMTKRLLIVVLIGLISAVTIWELCAFANHRRSSLVLPEYIFVAAIVLLGTSAFDQIGQDIAARVGRMPAAQSVSTAALVLLAFVPLGMWQFGGFDHSSLILSGWYMHIGFVPFRDIPYTLPPLFYLGAGWAFRIFGIHWWAFVAAAGVFAVTSFLWLVALLRTANVSLAAAVSLAFVTELATILLGAYWWYNSASAVAVIVMLAAALALLRTPTSRFALVSVTASVALLLLAKPNSWPALGCAAILVTVRGRRARVLSAAAVLGGIVFAAVACLLHGFSPVDVLRTYVSIAESRGAPDLLGLSGWSIWNLAFAAFLVAGFGWLFFSGFSEWNQHWREYECCAFIALASIWMAFTNYEVRLSDLMPLVAASVMLSLRPWLVRPAEGLHRRFASVVLVIFAIWSGYLAITRARVRGIGEGMYFELPAAVEINDGFFAGMHTGPRLPSVVSQMRDVLQRRPQDVFFGPRMEFAYVLFQRTPGRRLPLFWHRGTGYPVSATSQIVDAFHKNNFSTLIFLRGPAHDFQRLPGPLLVDISRRYDRIDKYPDIIVFVRR